MTSVQNLTAFEVQALPSLTREACDVLVICVAGRFEFPEPGSGEPPKIADEQVPPRWEDRYWGEPGETSLRYEGQTAYTRESTDIYVTGNAYAPQGRASADVRVRVRIGPCEKQARVFGDRVWRRGVMGLSPSDPKPFTEMPLVYERAFGGAAERRGDKPPAYEARNPVGVGLYGSAGEAKGKPLPNVEDPSHPIRSWRDRPPPVGFGPVARSWQPRAALAGTYDEGWVEKRAPLWPLDFDTRFFQAASAGLSAVPHLQGGEPVLLEGLSPRGPIKFELPKHRLSVRTDFVDGVDRRSFLLDAVAIEPEDAALTLIWRATIPTNGGRLLRHRRSLVRELENWEEGP